MQEQGRRGVQATRRWLEATTFIELPFNAYEDPRWCSLKLLNGKTKSWDLAGFFLGEQRNQLMVENKKYSTDGNQGTAYKRFLAEAYSATAQEIADYGQSNAEFAWVTTHPFSVKTWASLSSKQTVVEAIQENVDVLAQPDDEIDEELAATVAERTWLLVLNEKQENLSLTRKELDVVLGALGRKEHTL